MLGDCIEKDINIVKGLQGLKLTAKYKQFQFLLLFYEDRPNSVPQLTRSLGERSYACF
jgi:hypothetical protein